MAAESIICTITDGVTDYTFYKVTQSGYASRFAWTGNTSSVRLFLDFSHEVAPLGSLKSDVHNATIRREEVNATTGKTVVSSISLQIKVPKDSAISTADNSNDLSLLMSLFNKTFMDYFMVGTTQPGDYNVTGPFNPDRD